MRNVVRRGVRIIVIRPADEDAGWLDAYRFAPSNRLMDRPESLGPNYTRVVHNVLDATFHIVARS